jgi:malate dehydrogenase (oxaloacetate-decarboxylating)
MTKKMNVKDLLVKANKPKELAMKYHPFYTGKLQVAPKVPIRTFQDFSVWYTPGVAEPCKDIHKTENKVYEHTNKSNFVAVISDGTRVLGLGNIGAEASLPVMEGKALLFKYLGGVDAFPICLGTDKAENIISAVKWLTPTFGGINLEDIQKPKCYYILEKLQEELTIPVWHDDQQGTALVTIAGLFNALKVVGKNLSEVQITLVGAGSANMNVAKYLIVAGVKAENIIIVDSKGILHSGRVDVKEQDSIKWEMCKKTNIEERTGDIKDALKDVDVLVAYSRAGPGVIKKKWVAKMADDSIVLAGANPIPEIWPWEAKEAGAKIVATGRSDFPNQVNNSLGFPSVFRGALDVMSMKITDEMCISAAHAIANYAQKKGIHEEYIIPTMGETEMFIEEAVAVGLKAMEQGVAKKKVNKKVLRAIVSSKITNAQEMTKVLMREKLIVPIPK